MSIGSSGRVVIEMDPALKRQLYSLLTREGLTLKEWFTREVETYVEEALQPSLALHGGPSKKSMGER